MGSDGWVEHSNEMQKYRFPRVIVFWVGGITTDIGLHERVLDTYQGIQFIMRPVSLLLLNVQRCSRDKGGTVSQCVIEVADDGTEWNC